jgi:hypothetical protein
MKNKQERIFLRLNSAPLSSDETWAIKTVDKHLGYKGGHIVAYKNDGGLLMQVWKGDNQPSLKLRKRDVPNTSPAFVGTGVSPYTLCDHIEMNRSIVETI